MARAGAQWPGINNDAELAVGGVVELQVATAARAEGQDKAAKGFL